MSDRPQRPPVGDLPAFDQLDRTHQRIMEQLEQLQLLLTHLDRVGLDAHARALSRSICQFFEHDARQHHAEEEKTIFPGLLKSGSDKIQREVRRLQQDHGWLEEDWRAIQPHLESVAEGYAGYDLDMLNHALPVYSQLYREHIALEEQMIYPESRRQYAQLRDGAAERSDDEPA